MQRTRTELEDLNSRLAAYVHRVKKLKDEDDIKAMTSAIAVLEEDLRSLKASYECQVNHLSCSMRILTEEKYELEKELLVRKSNDSHYMDRISLEASKNAKLLLEISASKTDISQKDHELMTLNLRIKQLQMEAGDGQSQHDGLLEEVNDLKQNDVQENLSNELSNATQKLAAQEKLSNERIVRLKSRLDWYIAQFAANDARVQEVNRKEAAIPEMLAKLRKVARDELRQHQQQVTAFFRKSLSTLQTQLSNERKENRSLKTRKNEADQMILKLQKDLSENNAQSQSLQHQNRLLESAVNTSQKEMDQSRSIYDEKLRHMEASIAEHTAEAESNHGEIGTVRKELSRLRSMLEDEERRLCLNQTARVSSNGYENKFDSDPLTSPSGSDVGGRIRFSPRKQEQLPENFDTDLENEPSGRSQHCRPNPSDEPYRNSRDSETTNARQPTQDAQSDSEPFFPSPKDNQSGHGDSTRRYGNNCNNAVGRLQICEVDPDGRFMRIWNASDQNEVDLSLNDLIQNVDGQRLNYYRLPNGIRLGPNSMITLWANCTREAAFHHDPPKSVHCPDVVYWGYGPMCTTMLCDPSGQVLAWMNAPYRSKTCRNERVSYNGSNGDLNAIGWSQTMVGDAESMENSTRIGRQTSYDQLTQRSTESQQQGTRSGRARIAPDVFADAAAAEEQDPNTHSDGSRASQTRTSSLPPPPARANTVLPSCMCDGSGNFASFMYTRKPKRPITSQLFIQPEYPSTLGLRPTQKNKASIPVRSPPISLLKRPQAQMVGLSS